MKQLPIVVLKGCSYVGVSLCRLHLPSAFDGRTGFDMDTSHVLPQGVLNTITCVGGVACDGGTRVCSGFEAELPLCSVVLTTLSRAGSAPKLLEQKP